MLRIIAVAGLALLCGIFLALGTGAWPLRPGLIGLAILIAAALAVRRYWERLQSVGAEPGSPERALWHGLAGTALVAGHLFASLWMVGPAMELHSRFVHAFATDNWIMVLGTVLSYRIARDSDPRSDERDRHFSARGLKAGYVALIASSIVISIGLSFGDHTWVERLTRAMISHLLISSVIVAVLVQYAVQLRLYRIDHLRAAAPA
jgi:hypothetical protein